MRSVTTEIEIPAPPEDVWAVLLDFPRYGGWNPFIREAGGRAERGGTLRLRMHPTKGRPVTFRPKVLIAEVETELRWRGKLWIPGLFDGEHHFLLTDLGTPENPATRVHHGETFRGMLVPVLGAVIRGAEHDFRLMNEALAERATARYAERVGGAVPAIGHAVAVPAGTDGNLPPGTAPGEAGAGNTAGDSPAERD
ncbi:SRPBCC domain-containing protein [Streptomyces sp. ST2-7A]|uniref:SRPBCC domain-containing protein n=1 Tax=Streptomyces sp. ST2-7A TaxID=2907214 RepID=UPI001F17E5D3|nr:SRPBCC domain-containing protein [Streptomyces sp. ST2-7A]MCE7083334.1 SRPBCC domain-containing protein [Streptomyces sp. ST2-7A]